MKQAVVPLITLIIGIAIGVVVTYTVTTHRHYQVVSSSDKNLSVFVRINTWTGKTWMLRRLSEGWIEIREYKETTTPLPLSPTP